MKQAEVLHEFLVLVKQNRALRKAVSEAKSCIANHLAARASWKVDMELAAQAVTAANAERDTIQAAFAAYRKDHP